MKQGISKILSHSCKHTQAGSTSNVQIQVEMKQQNQLHKMPPGQFRKHFYYLQKLD